LTGFWPWSAWLFRWRRWLKKLGCQQRTRQYWEAKYPHQTFRGAASSGQDWLLQPASLTEFLILAQVEPTRRERLAA
jgi:hypothetical protein